MVDPAIFEHLQEKIDEDTAFRDVSYSPTSQPHELNVRRNFVKLLRSSRSRVRTGTSPTIFNLNDLDM